jgi:hypothetical protein
VINDDGIPSAKKTHRFAEISGKTLPSRSFAAQPHEPNESRSLPDHLLFVLALDSLMPAV